LFVVSGEIVRSVGRITNTTSRSRSRRLRSRVRGWVGGVVNVVTTTSVPQRAELSTSAISQQVGVVTINFNTNNGGHIVPTLVGVGVVAVGKTDVGSKARSSTSASTAVVTIVVSVIVTGVVGGSKDSILEVPRLVGFVEILVTTNRSSCAKGVGVETTVVGSTASSNTTVV